MRRRWWYFPPQPASPIRSPSLAPTSLLAPPSDPSPPLLDGADAASAREGPNGVSFPFPLLPLAPSHRARRDRFMRLTRSTACPCCACPTRSRRPCRSRFRTRTRLGSFEGGRAGGKGAGSAKFRRAGSGEGGGGEEARGRGGREGRRLGQQGREWSEGEVEVPKKTVETKTLLRAKRFVKARAICKHTGSARVARSKRVDKSVQAFWAKDDLGQRRARRLLRIQGPSKVGATFSQYQPFPSRQQRSSAAAGVGVRRQDGKRIPPSRGGTMTDWSVCVCVQLIFSVFKTLTDQEVTVELKNDLSIIGTLKSVDQYALISPPSPHLEPVLTQTLLGQVPQHQAREHPRPRRGTTPSHGPSSPPRSLRPSNPTELDSRRCRWPCATASSEAPSSDTFSYQRPPSTRNCWKTRREGVSLLVWMHSGGTDLAVLGGRRRTRDKGQGDRRLTPCGWLQRAQISPSDDRGCGGREGDVPGVLYRV